MWCTIVLWACGMQAEFVCIYAQLIIRGWYLSRLCSSNAGLMMWNVQNRTAIYTVFVLGTINAMMNLNNSLYVALICVETNWPGSWFTMAVLCYLLNPHRGTLQTSKKRITQSEESYSTLISNPEILIMLKNIRAYTQKTNQT